MYYGVSLCKLIIEIDYEDFIILRLKGLPSGHLHFLKIMKFLTNIWDFS